MITNTKENAYIQNILIKHNLFTLSEKIKYFLFYSRHGAMVIHVFYHGNSISMKYVGLPCKSYDHL